MDFVRLPHYPSNNYINIALIISWLIGEMQYNIAKINSQLAAALARLVQTKLLPIQHIVHKVHINLI